MCPVMLKKQSYITMKFSFSVKSRDFLTSMYSRWSVRTSEWDLLWTNMDVFFFSFFSACSSSWR